MKEKKDTPKPTMTTLKNKKQLGHKFSFSFWPRGVQHRFFCYPLKLNPN
jgi:hypothetical protein